MYQKFLVLRNTTNIVLYTKMESLEINSQDPGASRCINKMQVKLFLNRGSARKAAYDWSKI